MNQKDLKEGTKLFAHNCVKIAMELPENALGWHLRGQLIRSSTSVAANYSAACVAQSRKSFIAKISIEVEEIDESQFWLEFIIFEQLLGLSKLNDLFKEANELRSIFVSSRITAQKNIKQSTINN
jgi:four helix bundle protein